MFDLSKFSLQGKVAIVTGGGRGIGKAVAQGFAKAGAKVAITSRKINDLEAAAAEIRGFGGEALPVQAHLAKAEEISRMVGTVLGKFGRVDILVNNAGGTVPAPHAEDIPELVQYAFRAHHAAPTISNEQCCSTPLRFR